METYEEVKKFLAECGMNTEEHPKHKTWLNGFPYWHCESWEELREAMSHCSVPQVLGASFGPDEAFSVDIHDDFIWSNEDYRFDVQSSTQTAIEGES